jgi:phytoene desaturase
MVAVAVIGAGVAGLSAAARLAAAGHDVTVFEASATIGGKLGEARFQTDVGEFRFDTGPSLLTWPAVFRELFAATGEPLEDALVLRRLDPIARYRFADGARLAYRAQPAALRAEVAARFGAAAAADWARFLRRSAAIWRAAERPYLRRERTGAQLLGALRWAPRLPSIAPGRTLHELARSYLHDPQLRMIAERYATYAGGSPRHVPASFAAIAHLESAQGGWSVDGGLRRLSEAIAQRAGDRGARIELGAPVRRILLRGSSVAGIELADGRRVAADVVVSTADAASTYEQMVAPPRTPAGLRFAAAARRLRTAPRSLAGYVLLLGVRGRTPEVAEHNVLFPADYDAEFDSIFDAPARIPTDPTIYVQISSDPRSAPPGHEAWFVLVNVARHDPGGAPDALDWDNPALGATLAERVLSLLAARGLPVRERLVLTSALTPADLQRSTLAPGGSIYGTAPHGPIGALRPANRTAIRGLLLAGGSAHPGGGLPLAAMSGALVARRVGPS